MAQIRKLASTIRSLFGTHNIAKENPLAVDRVRAIGFVVRYFSKDRPGAHGGADWSILLCDNTALAAAGTLQCPEHIIHHKITF